MFYLENLLEENPRLFRKMILQDGTIVYVYMRHDRYFGWSIIERDGHRETLPAIGKLQYPFEQGFGDDEVYIYPELTHEAKKFDYGTLILKYDGFWTMAWKFKDKIVFRTRQKPFIGQRSATARVLSDLKLAEKVEPYIDSGLYPMFEIWGPGLEKYDLLTGGTRVGELREFLGLKEDIIPTVIGAFDKNRGRFLSYNELKAVFDEFYVAETVKAVGINDDVIPFHPKPIFEVLNRLESWNLKRGMKKADYFIDYNKITIRVPMFDNPGAVLEGVVLQPKNDYAFRGFKLKPWTIYVIDTYTKKRPPQWRIKQEVVKALSDMDELDAAKNIESFMNKVFDYLSEDYKLTVAVKREVRQKIMEILADIILKNHPEYRHIHPRELAKQGWSNSFIGVFRSRI